MTRVTSEKRLGALMTRMHQVKGMMHLMTLLLNPSGEVARFSGLERERDLALVLAKENQRVRPLNTWVRA